jgi:Spy/CpxP family protein refolding chaperone
MKIRTFGILTACSLMTLAATSPAAVSPYAGQENRPIKALSSDEIDAYLAGKGMGLARAAELNGYPGPRHVLEVAAELHLTPEQRQSTEALFASMQAEAQSLGRALVDAEKKLDQLFASQTITPESLSNTLQEIASVQAQLRGAHLKAHLAEVRILATEQNAQYAKMRGYGESNGQSADHSMHHH